LSLDFDEFDLECEYENNQMYYTEYDIINEDIDH